MSPEPLRIERLSSAGISEFLDFPTAIYRDDPLWVPPLRVWESWRLWGALRAGLVLLVARRGSVVGTLSVRKDGTFAESGLVWFGHFECIDDLEVARALLEAGREVARAWGGRVLRGPQSLSRFEYVGLTVAGHDRLPPLMQGQHPPYYERLLGALLSPHHDVLAYETLLVEEGDGGSVPRPLPEALLQKAAEARRALPDIAVRAAGRWTMRTDLAAVFSVLNAAYVTVPDVRPMSRATFLGFGWAMFLLAGPGLIQVAWRGETPVGFAVCIPEVHEALARCRGRLWPLGWARLLGGLWGVETAAFKLIGVLPELRGSGLHAALIAAVVEGAQRAGYRRVDGSIIDARNGPMRGVVEGVGMTVYRRYRVYEDGLRS